MIAAPLDVPGHEVRAGEVRVGEQALRHVGDEVDVGRLRLGEDHPPEDRFVSLLRLISQRFT